MGFSLFLPLMATSNCTPTQEAWLRYLFFTDPPGIWKDFYSQATVSESGKFKGKEIVFVGYGIDDSAYSDYRNLNVKGKIVLFFLGEPKKDGKYLVNGSTRGSEWTYPGLSKKLAVAASKGAAGAFVINTSQATFLASTIEANRKSSVYYPRTNPNSKSIGHAILSHQFARQLFNNNFDTLLAMARHHPIEPSMDLLPKGS